MILNGNFAVVSYKDLSSICSVVFAFYCLPASLRLVVSSSAQSDPQPCQRMINHVSYPHCLLPWQLNPRFVSVSRLSRYSTSSKFLLSLICLRFSLIHFLYCVIHAFALISYSSFFLLPSFSPFYFCVSFNRDADGRFIQ